MDCRAWMDAANYQSAAASPAQAPESGKVLPEKHPCIKK
jgi:hypothetical protein